MAPLRRRRSGMGCASSRSAHDDRCLTQRGRRSIGPPTRSSDAFIAGRRASLLPPRHFASERLQQHLRAGTADLPLPVVGTLLSERLKTGLDVRATGTLVLDEDRDLRMLEAALATVTKKLVEQCVDEPLPAHLRPGRNLFDDPPRPCRARK